MSIIRAICNTVLDAIFPLSDPEQALFSLSPVQAWNELPPPPPLPIADAAAVFAYKDDRVSRLVWHIKYKKSTRAIAIGGHALYRALSSGDPISSETIVILPMPITDRRRRERGFNQCELLADEIARLDTGERFRIEKSLLIRTHHLSRQTLKNREDRIESAKGIFAVDERVAAIYRRSDLRQLIVIDDVITTGSTMLEAIETLKSAGFPDISGLALAH